MRVAITRGALENPPVALGASPTVPVANTILFDHRWNPVAKDLPALGPTVEPWRTSVPAEKVTALESDPGNREAPDPGCIRCSAACGRRVGRPCAGGSALAVAPVPAEKVPAPECDAGD